jgi:hypothetical protein
MAMTITNILKSLLFAIFISFWFHLCTTWDCRQQKIATGDFSILKLYEKKEIYELELLDVAQLEKDKKSRMSIA